MLNPKIENYLSARYPTSLVEVLLDSYNEVLTNYRIEKWKPSELDAGHFVEAARRIIEQELLGTYTALNESMGSFNQAILNKYESAHGDESFRIIIPRILFSIYCIRNKRGVGHISSITPNKLDATYILNSTKWVLAELTRIAASSSPDDAYELTSAIIEKEIDLIWDDGETFMILNSKLKTAQKTLLALYKKDRQNIETLRALLNYKNKTDYNKLIKKLKSENLIDITTDFTCKLSPLGIREAETIIANY